MSEIVASAIIQKRRLEQFVETFTSNPSGMEGELIEEAKIHFNDDGITTTAVDAANVAMVGPANLAPRGFEAYDSPGSVTIGIDLTTLLERIGPSNASELIELEVDMETRHLIVRYGEGAELSVALLDPDSIRQEPDVNEFDHPNEIVLTGSRLSRAIKICGMVSDYIDIEGNPDEREVVFRGEGDTDENTVSYGDDETEDGTQVDEGVFSRYSSGYCQAISNPIPDDQEVTVKFGDDFPLRVEWEAFDGALTVMQTVAPRVNTS